jgi:hypothetical protein
MYILIRTKYTGELIDIVYYDNLDYLKSKYISQKGYEFNFILNESGLKQRHYDYGNFDDYDLSGGQSIMIIEYEYLEFVSSRSYPTIFLEPINTCLRIKTRKTKIEKILL